MDPSLRNGKLLDQIGWKLLHELQRNGRLSYAELGRRVGLTTPAVVERVRRMEEAGIIIGYHADIDPLKVGMPITAFIRMSVVGDVFNKITALVKTLPEVVECHRGTGADSFIMKVHVRSVEHLESLIDRLTPCGTTSTSIVLSSPVERREIPKPEETATTLTMPQRKQVTS
jgi:Lrp/AsnC family leucine-responsive transcriptional regulator